MVTYTCDKCRKTFSHKGNYTKHTNKKKTCIIETISTCEAETIIKADTIPNSRHQKYADLFCGLGAFHTAFDAINTLNATNNSNTTYTCVFACDIDETVRKLYQDNHGITPHGDINQLEIEKMPEFDILCAGFPCQPFSISGKKEGFSDTTKGNLFFSILKIVDIKTPEMILLENVKNFVTIDDGNTFHIIQSELENRGYIVTYQVIDSKYYHCPQSRQRVYIVARKEKKYEFPDKPTNTIVPVSSIIDFTETRFLAYEEKYRLEYCKTNSFEESNDMVASTVHSKMVYKIIHKVTNKGGRQGERVYSIESCGPTICASSGGPGAKTGLYCIPNDLDAILNNDNNNDNDSAGKTHVRKNIQIRRLNVVECLKMFGFSENYKWRNIAKEEDMLFYLGNSIVVNVLVHLLENL